MIATNVMLTADPQRISDVGNSQLIVAALVGIAVVVLLITVVKLHPMLALLLGSAALGIVAQVAPLDIIDHFTTGFGATVGDVGLLIALGAMIGKILADSGGSNVIVDTIVGKVGRRWLPWAMALLAAILGLPLFFEVGVVLLVPVVALVALRTDLPIMRIGIPALAGLSILHGMVPPHPGPLVAITNLHADLGLTLLFGLALAIPTLIICGPLLAHVVAKWVPVHASASPAAAAIAERGESAGRTAVSDGVTRKVHFGWAVFCICLPVLLMLARAIGEIAINNENNSIQKALTLIGEPSLALLIACLAAMIILGFGSGMNRSQVEKSVGSGLPGIAGILLIVAAGGGFKTLLVDAGVGDVIQDWAHTSNLNPLLLGWLVAVGVRLATGSASVATITASGIVAGVAADLSSPEVALLVIAIGVGSLFFSHVNDAGFWLVKEYFGLTVGQTFKSWSLMETAISVVGLVLVLIVDVFI